LQRAVPGPHFRAEALVEQHEAQMYG
jgi:hypothetical protein